MIALETLLTPSTLPVLWAQPALATGWPELDDALPDHGFPKGVIELTAPHGLGGATSVALAAIHAAQKKNPRAWCAWVDSQGTLYGPGVAKAGVDLDRLLVVRPPVGDAGRIAVKVALARACEVVVVDLPGASLRTRPDRRHKPGSGREGRGLHPEILVRKLALAAEESGASVFLLTDSLEPRDLPWPVALRLELGRAPSVPPSVPGGSSAQGHIVVKVAKDRRGRIGQGKTVVPMQTRPEAPLKLEVG